MMISLDDENITGIDLENLLDFCFQHSDRVALTTALRRELAAEEIIELKQKDQEAAMARNQQYKRDYEENKEGFRDRLHQVLKKLIGDSKEKAFQYFDDLLEQDLSMKTSFDDIYGNKDFEGMREFNPFDFVPLPLLSIETTNITAVTRGPVVNLCYFRCDEMMRHKFTELTSLFGSFMIAEASFDDMTFYQGDRALLAVCSHEHYATLELTEEECKEFFRLELPYDIPSEHWWEKEYMENYAREDGRVPIVIEPAMIGDSNGSVSISLRPYDETQAIWEKHKDLIKPNFRSISEILSIIKQKYITKEDNSIDAQRVVRGNVLFNTCFAKRLPKSHEAKITVLHIEKEGDGIALYEKQKDEYRELMKRKKESGFPFHIFYNGEAEEELPQREDMDQDGSQLEELKEEIPIVIGAEHYSGYIYVEGSSSLRDEITLLRGLDEKELLNPTVVANYVEVLKRNGKSVKE